MFWDLIYWLSGRGRQRERLTRNSKQDDFLACELFASVIIYGHTAGGDAIVGFRGGWYIA